MFTFSKLCKLAAAGLAIALFAPAQDARLDARSSLKINLPPDAPVALVTPLDFGESRASARGGALVLDIHTGLTLRNADKRRIRGLTLVVLAQEVTPGGKAWVEKPSLNVGPGEVFPVRLDMRLLRPLQTGTGPLVEISLDGILFEDLSFYGPNKLNSRRSLTIWEMEARRDRQHFKTVLAANGAEALRKEMLRSLARQASRPQMDMQVARSGRATNIDAEQELQFAFLKLPDSPVEPVQGMARIVGNEARAPRLEVRNRSDKSIRYLEIGWILRDRLGREFMAGAVPAELNLAPGEKRQVLQDAALKFSERAGQPLAIEGMTGFVHHVEFGDGAVWIPTRSAVAAEPRLERVLAPSPEEQRLSEIYRRKGLAALVDELKRF